MWNNYKLLLFSTGADAVPHHMYSVFFFTKGWHNCSSCSSRKEPCSLRRIIIIITKVWFSVIGTVSLALFLCPYNWHFLVVYFLVFGKTRCWKFLDAWCWKLVSQRHRFCTVHYQRYLYLFHNEIWYLKQHYIQNAPTTHTVPLLHTGTGHLSAPLN